MTRKEYIAILTAEKLLPPFIVKDFSKWLWALLYNPSVNSIYLLRKMQYFASFNTPYKKIRTIQMKNLLLRRYGMCISPYAKIGKGLRIPHPTSIVIGAKTVIGDNFTIYQNTTIGGARAGDVEKGNQPVIGNNVQVFAGSMILGKVVVGNNVILGANSVLLSNAEENGVYVGTPAKRVN